MCVEQQQDSHSEQCYKNITPPFQYMFRRVNSPYLCSALQEKLQMLKKGIIPLSVAVRKWSALR